MRYVYVKNGEIMGNPVLLPKVWNNISNFNILDDETIKSYGWYPHRLVTADTTETTIVAGTIFVFENDEVVEYQQVREKTQEELNQEVIQKWNVIRETRNSLLQQSDWTQLPDSPISENEKILWKEYRQLLRDITQHETPDLVSWPEPPSNA